MAKGNLFLGMGRGSVGDVTFYRADGQQLSRARNRKPRNPKSNAQLIQRAISATIVQAYKAGSIIFDHSFEGKSVPAGSQRAFLSVNMRKLREQILNEINAAEPNSTIASVVSPRSVYPVPNPYRISEGSLVQQLFNVNLTNGTLAATLKPAENQGDETIAQYLTRLGISAGEIYTICAFSTNAGNRETGLISGQCTFGFMRLTVKTSAISSTTAMNSAEWGNIFEIDSSGANIDPTRSIDDGITISDLSLTASSLGSMGVIRSNENSGERSTTDMVTFADLNDENEWAVAPQNLLASWSQDSGSVDSELILEGGQI